MNSFYSRHKKAEINCEVLCDWNMNLVYVMPNFSRRTHDSDAWSQCSLARELRDDPGEYIAEGNYIVADEGYANQGIVIRLFSKRGITNIDTFPPTIHLFFPPFYDYYKSGPNPTTERAILLGRLY